MSLWKLISPPLPSIILYGTVTITYNTLPHHEDIMQIYRLISCFTNFGLSSRTLQRLARLCLYYVQLKLSLIFCSFEWQKLWQLGIWQKSIFLQQLLFTIQENLPFQKLFVQDSEIRIFSKPTEFLSRHFETNFQTIVFTWSAFIALKNNFSFAVSKKWASLFSIFFPIRKHFLYVIVASLQFFP